MIFKQKNKRKHSVTKKSEMKYLGYEPQWTNKTPNQIELIRAYSWYTYFYEAKEMLDMFIEHYEMDKKTKVAVKAFDHRRFPTVLGAMARMKTLGCRFPQNSIDFYDKNTEEFIKQAVQDHKKRKSAERKIKKSNEKAPSIQDRVATQVREYISDLGYMIDSFTFEHDYQPSDELDVYQWLREKDIKQTQAKSIADHFRPLRDEIEEAIKGTDEQVVEFYSEHTKKQLRDYFNFVAGLVETCETWASNQKKTRKSRKKKPPSIEKQIKNIRYKQEDPDLKLVSIPPGEIIGAQRFWFYNVKYKKLTRLNSQNPEGLMVKGASVINIDPDKSVQKTLRKPEETLKKVLGGGKRILNGVMEDLKTKGYEPNGRITKDCILLRAEK